MTAEELLNSLSQSDVIVTANGERLLVDAPRGILTKELRRTLTEHKPEILQYLHGRSHNNAVALPTAGDVDAEGIAEMSLNVFAKAGLIVQVWSEYLGCEVVFVSDDVPETALANIGLPIYRASELRKLAILSPAPRGLRMVHDVKTIFNGTIVDHEGPAGMVATAPDLADSPPFTKTSDTPFTSPHRSSILPNRP